VSGAVRQDAADTKPVRMTEDETPTAAAEIRALADEAEAEAEEAEALAAAARARVRAIQLRRKAGLVEEAATAEVATAAAVTKEAAIQDLPDAAQTVERAKPSLEPEDVPEADTTAVETESDETVSDETESAETEEVPDDAEDEPEADASSDDVEKPRRLQLLRRRPKLSTIAATVAVLVVIAAVSGSVYMVNEHRAAARKQQLVTEFTAAARQGVVTLTSLDYTHAKESVDRILDNATGGFKDDLGKTANDFIQVVERAKVISQGSVQAIAVQSDTMTNDQAEVLVASTAEITNAAGAKQDPRSYRLIVTVTRDGDRLKLSKVEFVP